MWYAWISSIFRYIDSRFKRIFHREWFDLPKERYNTSFAWRTKHWLCLVICPNLLKKYAAYFFSYKIPDWDKNLFISRLRVHSFWIFSLVLPARRTKVFIFRYSQWNFVLLILRECWLFFISELFTNLLDVLARPS